MTNWLLPTQLVTGALESILNQALSRNVNPDLDLLALEGKQLTLAIDEFGSPITLGVANKSFYVLSQTQASDCTISSSVRTLLDLKQSQQLTEYIKQEKLDIQGDLKVAQGFAKVFESLTIDWQSELAKHIGDVATYRLTRFGQFMAGKAKFAQQQISQDASQYLVFEKKLAVTGYEISMFRKDVDQLNLAVDALHTRIEKLNAALTSSTKE